MKKVPVSNIRTLSIMGHTASGKTSLTEAILAKLGISDRLGTVDNGTTMSDYTAEEKARKISIYATSFSGTYKTSSGKEHELVLIDTPGYLDFFGQVISSLHATETGLIAVDAVAGIAVGTRQAWKCCKERNIARAFVITGLDRENADYDKVLSDIQSVFGPECVPVMLPLPDASGVIDVLSAKDIPDAVADRAEEIKNTLVERAAETDDTLIEKYLGGEDLSPDEISNGLRSAVASGGLVPVFCAVPTKEIGTSELLDGIARLLPSPADLPAKDNEGNEIAVDSDQPFVGLVWRTVNDPFVGQLTFVRVLGGKLTADSEIHNVNKDQKERVSSLLAVNGKSQDTIVEAVAGDIVALPKLKFTAVNDTLGGPGVTTRLDPIVFPKPVMFQSITAKTQADEDKIGTALSRVSEEDPTLQVTRNAETKEIVMGGLGDVHIDVTVEKMKSRSHVEVVLDTPKVPYRETATSMGEGHYRHKKQSGGRGQYGEVYLRVEPKQPEDEEWFVDAVVGGAIPGNFMPAVQKGLVEGMQNGPMAGYPVTDIKISVYDGSYHDVDSSEIAFKIAGSRALREGLSNANPVLLEPIMKVKVMIPEQFMGDVTGDLNHKRGRILGMGTEADLQVITADVPQVELFRYAAELRSVTGGQGTFEMEFSRYEQVPANVAQKVIAESKRDDEE